MKTGAILVLILVFSFSFVSAFSFGDFFKGITGNVVQASSEESLPLDSFSVKGELKHRLVSRTFSESNEFSMNLPAVYGLTISANVEFENENGLVRVILVDSDGKEYLIYESYPLLTDSNSFSVKDVCEETCSLNSVKSASIRFEIENAKITIKDIGYSTLSVKSSQDEKSRVGKLQKEYKIKKINEKNKGWIAGETSVSNLSYEEKRALFKSADGVIPEKLPNLQGFEYYKGGVFEIKNYSEVSGAEASAVLEEEKLANSFLKSWDWRYVDGENWNTPVKDQGSAGTCWAFAAAATMEAQINLHYNKHINLDLSEQELVDSFWTRWSHYTDYFRNGHCWLWGMANEVYCVTKEEGIADEACDVYRETTNPNADFVCADYQNRSWKNGDFNSYLLPTDAQFEDYLSSTVNKSNDIILWNGENGLKKTLISKGPISTGVKSWGHAMELVGYSVDPVDGGTVWIFKNSWGEAFANSGYVLLKLPISDLFEFAQPRGPFTIPTDANYLPAGFNNQVKCSDKDKDGFCSWGISNIGADDAWRQVNCPASCVENSQKDCDESSAYIRGSINGQTCEFAPTPKTIMTCRKLVNYTVAWQKTKCNASDCGDDNYVGCNKKRTALGVKKFQEVCQRKEKYKTECSVNSNCWKDTMVEKVAC